VLTKVFSLPTVPDIGYVQRTFQMSAAFSQTPPSEDAPEPIWDSLVPGTSAHSPAPMHI